MMQRWKELFRRDFWLKVLAIALAILLWAMVVADYNKETSIPFDVALEVKQHPTLEMFEGRRDLDTTVEVQVTGPSLLVSSLTPGDLRAWVDYSRITEAGRTQDVEVQAEGPPRIRDQVRYRVTPSTVSVTLVEKRTANVPILVQPDSGVVPVGAREFRFTATTLEKNITMTDRMDYLKYVRWGIVNLMDLDLVPPLTGGELKEKTLTIRKPIQPVDSTGNKVEKLAQYYADVVLTWQELPLGKKVQVKPQTQGTLPTGFELASVTVEPEWITLRSATVEGALPDVGVLLTEPVDLTGQTKTFTTPARVLAPQGTSVAQASVNVTVTITEKLIEKIFGALPVGIVGQPAGIDVALPVPAVQVRLTGPYSLMQPLDASAVEVYVEVQGLIEGRHSVPVKVKYPPGVPEVAVDPAIIEVVITSR